MIVVCPNCQTRYGLNDTQVTDPVFMARCSKCRHIFSAYQPVRAEPIHFLDLDQAKKPVKLQNIIAISNQKGGVAKTSTCLNLGLALAMQNKRVLVIDFDCQANLTLSLGYNDTTSFYDSLNGDGTTFKQLMIATKYPNLWLFPSNKNMVLLNKKYFGARNFEYLLKDRLLTIREDFDFILIDTPPSIEFFTLNALTSSGLVIIPSQCDYLSTYGIDQILKLIDLIKMKTNPFLFPRILITMYDKESASSNLICSKLRQLYAERAFHTQIEMDNRVREAQILRMPVLQYNRESTAGLQYNELAKEILKQLPEV